MDRYSYASSSSSTGKLSTIWGPGTLTGKALEAFGKATLRGVENLVVRRKLASLRSVFPHRNDTTIKNIEQHYDDVLELSRYVYTLCTLSCDLRNVHGMSGLTSTLKQSAKLLYVCLGCKLTAVKLIT
jgi:hypothetical protein